MPILNLTQKTVDGIEPTEKLTHYFDEKLTGFGVDVKMSNKSFFVRGRINGIMVTYTFAKCNVMSVDKARKEAQKNLSMIHDGIHPGKVEKLKIAATKADLKKNTTLSQALDEYLENVKLKDRSIDYYRSNVNVYLKDWLNRPLRDISKEDIKTRHSYLSKKVVLPPKSKEKSEAAKKNTPKKVLTNGPGVADGVMKTLRALFNYAIEEHELEIINPVTPALKKKWNRLPARKGMLRPDQIGPWLHAVLASKNPPMRDALLLLLFTGLRSESEAFQLKWENIDFTAKTMHFLDTKNGIDLELPMSNVVHKIMTMRKKHYYESEYVFTSIVSKRKKAKDDTVEYSHISDVRKELRIINERAGVSITPHDLRRTFINYAENLDISAYTIKALVNHSMEEKVDVTAGYLNISVERKRAALRKITNYILKTAGVTEKDFDTLIP